MANEYARLLIDLVANTSQFTGEMQKAAKSITSFQSGIKRIGGALVGAFAISSVVRYVKSVADAADEQNELARRLGVTKSEVDALELSFTKGGQSIQQSEKTLDIFNRRIGELRAGETEMLETFERLGINVESFLGQSYVDRLITIKKTLEGMTEDARAFASQELFGRGGAKIYEGLKGLEEANAIIKEVNRELGITGEDVDNIDQMNDAFTELKKRLELVATALLTQFAPAIEDTATAAGKLAIQLSKIGDFRLAAGAAFEMAGGGLRGWWKAMQLSPNEVEETLAQWESYKAQLEQGRPSPRGGTLPTNLEQSVARGEFEKNKSVEDAEEQRIRSLTESFIRMFDSLDTKGAEALQKYQEGVRLVENAMAAGIITEEKKWEALEILADEYGKVVPNAIDETIKALEKEQALYESTMEAYRNLAMSMDYTPEQISFMEDKEVLYQAWMKGIIGAEEYSMRVNMLLAEMNNLLGATENLGNVWGGMQSLQPPRMMPALGIQVMDVGDMRFQAPGVAETMTASEAANMRGGVLEDVSKQQLTTQKNIETGINQMNYLLARGLI